MEGKFQKIGYIDSCFLTVKKILEELDIPCTYDYIEENIATLSSYPYLKIEDLSKFLISSFDIENEVIQIGIDQLSTVQLPAISFITMDKGCFVVIIEQNKKEIRVLHPYKGEIILKKEHSTNYWANSLILITDYNEHFEEPNYIEKKAFQDELADEFNTNHIQVIPDFFNSIECDFLVSTIKDKCNNYDNSNENFVVKLKEIAPSIFDKIIIQVKEITDKQVDCIEEPICIIYGEEKHNSLHYDVLDEIMGKHLYSFVIYLNDDFKGGETYFPKINLCITPVKGSALFFRNFDKDMNIFDASVHVGLPAYEGKKITCNIWVGTYPIS